MEQGLLAAIIGAAIGLIAVYLGAKLRGRSGPGVYSEYLCHRVVRVSLANNKIQVSPDVARLRLGGTLRWVVENAQPRDVVHIVFSDGGPFGFRSGYDANKDRGVFQTPGADIDTDPADKQGRLFKYTVTWTGRDTQIPPLDPGVMVVGEDI